MCAKKKDKKHKVEVDIPEEVEVNLENGNIVLKGENGQVKKTYPAFEIEVEKKEGKLLIKGKGTKRVKALVGTTAGDIRNGIRGVTGGINYKLKILYSHFPMNVNVQANEVVIENFIGEKHPRKVTIPEDIDVNIDGQEITVTGPDKDVVAQLSANLEQATRTTGLDERIFQDGIYIVEKDGKSML